MADVDGDFLSGQASQSTSEPDGGGDGDFIAGQASRSTSELDAMGDGDFLAGQTKGQHASQPTGGTPQFSYLMRAYDDTLDQTVFWVSQEVDGDGSDYTGPGPLLDVVVARLIAAPFLP